MLAIPSSKETLGQQEVMLAATTSFGSQIYAADWTPAMRSEIVLIEDGLSVRPLVSLLGWAFFIVQYRQYYYVAHGTPFVGVPALPTSTEFRAQLSVIE
jgi:hypothetical protein